MKLKSVLKILKKRERKESNVTILSLRQSSFLKSKTEKILLFLFWGNKKIQIFFIQKLIVSSQLFPLISKGVFNLSDTK